MFRPESERSFLPLSYRSSVRRHFVIRDEYIWKEGTPQKVRGGLFQPRTENFKSSEILLNLSSKMHAEQITLSAEFYSKKIDSRNLNCLLSAL